MHRTDVLILLTMAVCAAAMLLVLHLTRAGRILHERIPDRPRRRLFLASLSFFLTFLAVRLLVAAIMHHIGPFGWVTVHGRHIHHLVWGILLLLLTGYLMLAEFGNRGTPISLLVSRLIAIGFGMGAALTLDEFALWLDLDPNAYWTRQGRVSIDAVVLFGALLAVGAWGAPSGPGAAAARRSNNAVSLPRDGSWRLPSSCNDGGRNAPPRLFPPLIPFAFPRRSTGAATL